jgi:hypothetical protein
LMVSPDGAFCFNRYFNFREILTDRENFHAD